MKLFKFLSVLIITFFSSITIVFSIEKIAFLDLDYIFNNSKSGKLIIEELKALNDFDMKSISASEKKIKDQENEIKQIQNISSEEELNKKINSLKNNINELKILREDMYKKFKSAKEKKLDDYFKKINPLIEKYMSDNSIQIIFDKKNIFKGSSSLNITKDIINLIDANG